MARAGAEICSLFGRIYFFLSVAKSTICVCAANGLWGVGGQHIKLCNAVVFPAIGFCITKVCEEWERGRFGICFHF